ncbi:MAG: hypothetical protein ACU84H_10040 [Gammaproteobacteria bacterium]
MNKFYKILVDGLLVLALAVGGDMTATAGAQSGMTQTIKNTVTHLEEGIRALQTNDPDTAQEHMKAAGQSSKKIIGGSYEVKAQRGSRAIATARRQTKEGDTTSAAASLKQAIDIYKSLLSPDKAGGRGGLK